MAIQNYKELIVWQKAMELATLVYQTTKKPPKGEIYFLTNQMRMAAVAGGFYS